MTPEPVTKKRKLWQAVVVMLFVSCLLAASGVFLSLISDGHPEVFLLLSKSFLGLVELS